MPIQPAGAREAIGTAVVDPAYEAGPQDLEGFSHLYLLNHFHRAAPRRFRVIPFLDRREHGIFATRAPSRPNPIGLSIVECPVWLVLAENSETFWLLSRRGDAGLAKAKPRRRNEDSGQKGRN